MPMEHRGGHVEYVEQQRDRQQSPGGNLSHPQQASQRGPEVDAQAAHADRDRRTVDYKTSRRVLVTEAGEEASDKQRDEGVARGQEGRRQRGQGQNKDGEGKL